MDDYAYQLNSSSIFPWSAVLWVVAGIAALFFVLWLFKKYLDRKNRWSLFLQNQSVPAIVKNLIQKEYDGPGFEVWVQQLFLSLGIPAKVTGGFDDHGIDVVAEYKNKKIGIQCKKRGRNNLITEPVLRDLYGAQRHGGFDEAMLITTGNFSREAIAWAKGKKDLKLVNGNLLGKIITNRGVLLELLNQ